MGFLFNNPRLRRGARRTYSLFPCYYKYAIISNGFEALAPIRKDLSGFLFDLLSNFTAEAAEQTEA
jgi:hypothetical protein